MVSRVIRSFPLCFPPGKGGRPDAHVRRSRRGRGNWHRFSPLRTEEKAYLCLGIFPLKPSEHPARHPICHGTILRGTVTFPLDDQKAAGVCTKQDFPLTCSSVSGATLPSNPRECLFCNGTGVCHRCRGTGTVRTHHGHAGPCRECGESGKCGLCQGRGWLDQKEPGKGDEGGRGGQG